MSAQIQMAARVLHLQRTSTDNAALSDRWSIYAAASTNAPQAHQVMADTFGRLALEAVEELRKLADHECVQAAPPAPTNL
jgi:hypothetical protein